MCAGRRWSGRRNCPPLPGVETYLKLEHKQEAGSFKPRISFSKLLALPENDSAREVIASTAGGHGMGLSFAGSKLEVPVHVHLPHSADAAKVDFMKRHGAKLTCFSSVAEARVAAQERAAREPDIHLGLQRSICNCRGRDRRAGDPGRQSADRLDRRGSGWRRHCQRNGDRAGSIAPGRETLGGAAGVQCRPEGLVGAGQAG